MEKEFVPYEQALALKELGFNNYCLTCYLNGSLQTDPSEIFWFQHSYRSHSKQEFVSAPTFSQAFRFFREKYGLDSSIQRRKEKVDDKWVKREFYSYFIENNEELPVSLGLNLKDDATYEQAELACLKKLIEICRKLK